MFWYTKDAAYKTAARATSPFPEPGIKIYHFRFSASGGRLAPGRPRRIELDDVRRDPLVRWKTQKILKMFDVFDREPEKVIQNYICERSLIFSPLNVDLTNFDQSTAFTIKDVYRIKPTATNTV